MPRLVPLCGVNYIDELTASGTINNQISVKQFRTRSSLMVSPYP